jgi:hypothetical protein
MSSSEEVKGHDMKSHIVNELYVDGILFKFFNIQGFKVYNCRISKMSETNQIINPSQPSASEVRRQKREEARLAQAQRVTKVAATRRTVTVYEGDPGTYRDLDPMNTRGWTFVTRSFRARNTPSL